GPDGHRRDAHVDGQRTRHVILIDGSANDRCGYGPTRRSLRLYVASLSWGSNSNVKSVSTTIIELVAGVVRRPQTVLGPLKFELSFESLYFTLCFCRNSITVLRDVPGGSSRRIAASSSFRA